MRRARSGGIVLALLAATLVAGCGDGVPEIPAVPVAGCQRAIGAGSLALVVGGRANSPAPADAEADGYIRAAASRKQVISVVTVEGEPQVTFDQRYESTARNPTAGRGDWDKYVQGALGSFSGARARSPQANLLSALTFAARNTAENGTIVVFDSGLQTIAPLDFRQPGMVAAYPDEVSRSLDGDLPDLSKRQVVFAGLGDVAKPQSRLPTHLRNNLVAIWQKIATDAHASCAVALPRTRTAAAPAGVPVVARVTLPVEPPRVCGRTRLLDSGAVGFEKGSSRLRDPQAADAELAELAAKLQQTTALIRVIGTTAFADTEAVRKKLSTQRAIVVRDALARLGVARSRMKVEGVGAHYRYRVPDLDADGTLLPGPAAQNRSVVVEAEC